MASNINGVGSENVNNQGLLTERWKALTAPPTSWSLAGIFRNLTRRIMGPAEPEQFKQIRQKYPQNGDLFLQNVQNLRALCEQHFSGRVLDTGMKSLTAHGQSDQNGLFIRHVDVGPSSAVTSTDILFVLPNFHSQQRTVRVIYSGVGDKSNLVALVPKVPEPVGNFSKKDQILDDESYWKLLDPDGSEFNIAMELIRNGCRELEAAKYNYISG